MKGARVNARQIRDQLGHPVLDCDGHWREPAPVFLEYLADEGGAAAADRYLAQADRSRGWYEKSSAQRSLDRHTRPVWWSYPSDTRDAVTIMSPGLLYERADEFGIDFSLIYSSLGLGLFVMPDDELRPLAIRALNRMNAELFAPYADRFAPVAVVSTRTPDEAIACLNHAVCELGMKAVVLNGSNARVASDGRSYVDTIGLDSPFDYEGLWSRCVELGVAVTDHSEGKESNRRQSPTSFVFNHIGHFAEAMAASAKAIFLGGVPRRHPTLPFAFLEGGVGFAAGLLFDLEGHWEKRNVAALERQLRPNNIDARAFRELFEQHSHGRLRGRADDILRFFSYAAPHRSLDELTAREQDLDEFAASAIQTKDQLRAEFTRNFYFGCEADDPLTALAFDPRLDTGLKPIFGSDIGHFDVPVLEDVLVEAWELVEDGMITESDFRKFVFSNGVELHTALNPHFFDGTRIENEAAAERLTVAAP